MYNTSHSDLHVSQNSGGGARWVITFDPCVRVCVNKKQQETNGRARWIIAERHSTKQLPTAVTGSAVQSPDGVLFTAD